MSLCRSLRLEQFRSPQHRVTRGNVLRNLQLNSKLPKVQRQNIPHSCIPPTSMRASDATPATKFPPNGRQNESFLMLPTFQTMTRAYVVIASNFSHVRLLSPPARRFARSVTCARRRGKRAALLSASPTVRIRPRKQKTNVSSRSSFRTTATRT